MCFDFIVFSGQYVAAMIILLTLSTIGTVFVLTIHHEGELRGEVSPCLRRFVLEFLAKVVWRYQMVKRVLAGVSSEEHEVIKHAN